MDAAKVRVLSLDGGGAKGFYTLGVLREVEIIAGTALHQHFDLIFGTSMGASRHASSRPMAWTISGAGGAEHAARKKRPRQESGRVVHRKQ
jgi:hypothetical protein